MRLTCRSSINAYVDPAREHLPDMTTLGGVIDLFALCILGILCNVLDQRTYQYGPDPDPPNLLWKVHIDDDANNISTEERHKCIRTRGLAYDLIMWFFQTYMVTDNDTQQKMTRLTLFVPHIAQVTTAMILYVESHPDDPDSDLNTIMDEFRDQVESCFLTKKDIKTEVKKLMANSSRDDQCELNTLAYTGPRNLIITKRDKPTYESKYSRLLFKL